MATPSVRLEHVRREAEDTHTQRTAEYGHALADACAWWMAETLALAACVHFGVKMLMYVREVPVNDSAFDAFCALAAFVFLLVLRWSGRSNQHAKRTSFLSDRLTRVGALLDRVARIELAQRDGLSREAVDAQVTDVEREWVQLQMVCELK